MSGIATARDRESPPPFLRGAHTRFGKRRVRPGEIIAWVAERTEVAAIDIIGNRRLPEIVAARALCVWTMRGLCDRPSYPRIGRSLGGRHHSTVLSLHERAIYMRLKDPAFAQACIDITMKFQSEEKLHARF